MVRLAGVHGLEESKLMNVFNNMNSSRVLYLPHFRDILAYSVRGLLPRLDWNQIESHINGTTLVGVFR